MVERLRDDLHLIVARDDGNLEVWWFEERSQQADLVFETKENETITGLCCGHITSASKKEIIFSCYSGAIKSLVDKKAAKKMGAQTEDTS